MASPRPPALRLAFVGAPGTGARRLARLVAPRLDARRARIVHAGDGPAPARAGATLTLLLPGAGTAPRAEADLALRQALQSAGATYGVVHGRNPAERRRQALLAIAGALQAPAAAPLHSDALDSPAQGGSGRRRWSCECCGDPEAERRLFRALLDARATPAAA